MVSGSNYVMPGEFEPQSAVWLGWPTFQLFSDPALDTRPSLGTIAKTLSDYEVKTNIMCGTTEGVMDAQHWLTENGFPISSLMNFLAIDQVDIWVRDYGPIFLIDRSSEKRAIAGYRQNQWGYSTPTDPVSERMTKLPRAVFDYLNLDDFLSTEIISEGGDRIQNGQGVVLVDRAVEFGRNPDLSQDDLEAAYKSTLGATKIIWLNSGVREDLHTDWGPIPYPDSSGDTILLYGPQTTGGHLDEFCRFFSSNQMLLAQVSEQEAATDPIAAVNYTILADAYRVLSNSTDQDGNPFEIRRIPTPSVQYRLIQPTEAMYSQFLAKLKYSGDAPVFPDGKPVYIVRSSSYANFLVTNGLVIVPKYGDSDKDSEAHQALSEAFLNRDIVQIDPTPINYAGGGIHCITQQQPA